jgi:hypothetical protein
LEEELTIRATPIPPATSFVTDLFFRSWHFKGGCVDDPKQDLGQREVGFVKQNYEERSGDDVSEELAAIARLQSKLIQRKKVNGDGEKPKPKPKVVLTLIAENRDQRWYNNSISMCESEGRGE